MKRALIAGFLLILVAAGFYASRLGFSGDDHEVIEGRLARLRHLDSTFDEDLLRARFSLLENYDGFHHSLAEMDRLATALATGPGFASDAGRARIKQVAAELTNRLAERRQLFERFKSRNAVLANSRRYYPVALTEISDALDPAADRVLLDILQDLTLALLGNATSPEPMPEAVLAIPDQLRGWLNMHPRHPQAALVDSLISHARQLLEGENELDALTRQLLALPAATDIARLAGLSEAELSQTLQRSARYRRLLYALCALLAAATIYTLLALRLANRSLEHRVAERTAKLAEASGLLEAMLANSPDFIYFKDADSRFVRFSHALLLRFGLTDPEKLRGKTDSDFYGAEHAREALADEQAIISSGEPVLNKLERETHADGRITWVLTTKMPWRDGTGRIIGTFGISKDVTALKEAEDRLSYERDQLRALLDSSPDSIYFKDRDSRFVLISRSKAEKMLARIPGLRARLLGPNADPAAPVPSELFRGLSDADTYTDEHTTVALADEQAIMRTGEPLVGKTEKQTFQDGSIAWSLTNKMPWRDKDGQIIGTFGISKDITDLKQAEEKLEAVHRQLLDTSRAAGMAEVASSVLHNVGNVLNSVNVSATLVADTVRRSKIGNLGKLAGLLAEHQTDLGAYLTSDPKGKMVQPYLATLTSELGKEQETMLAELGHLRKNVDHIKDIVAMQQSYAKTSGITETISIPDLVEDAIRMNAGSLARHDVDLARDYQARPVLTLDKHKVLQILVNLIRNAKYACDESGRPDKRITLRITAGDGHVRIAVSDNGVGIRPENLTRIFNHGFTTRATGHGFGLHSGALAAKNMGGSLAVQSDGPGQGATFVLTLPLKPNA